MARNRSYTPEEVDQGLTAVAICNGNTRRAERELAAQGIKVTRAALQSWKRTKKDRYIELQETVLPEIRAKMAQQNEALARDYTYAEHKAVSQIITRLERAERTEWACSVKSCGYIATSYESFACPEHPEAAPEHYEPIGFKDLAGSTKNIAIAKGVATDKSLVLRGDPNVITQSVDVDTAISRLNRYGIRISFDADSTAEEEPVPTLNEATGQG